MHSPVPTGCQDIIQFFRQYPTETAAQLAIKGIILQAPVSDREYIADTLGKDKHTESVKVAKSVRRRFFEAAGESGLITTVMLS